MTNLEDIREANTDVFPGVAVNLGPFVAKAHMRHVLALQYDLISGGMQSGVSANVYDVWGTSNNIIDKFIIPPTNASGLVVSLSGTVGNFDTFTNNGLKFWPLSPRPDFAIGHVKESGVAQVQTSGAGFFVTMIYTDRPGGVY